ncbi:glycoside hydrolase family 43 protein [Paenibacillus sp. XY044]|uniref:glycoside hydrolase family 43 protein n=1 Tax=Paenibacillus sp. XY044 TaxID=2026089 RepID=UPI000B9816C0|nr:glycoside hydrolase family 43 protein [Paenibacillus sp. XY044]OZB98832.1 glycoside hydrolase 43 family protein [Paenibacillus sp. XY044]
MQYTNPVIPGFHPDPSICRVGDDYYLVTSTFEYFPGVPIFHSKDLVHWQQIGHCLTTEEQLPLANAGSSGGIYAPTLRYHDGMFYMTTTNVSGIGNFYVTSLQPAGPWSDPISVAQNGIDPSLFFDEDGRVYFQSTRTGDEGDGIYQCEIDKDTGEMLTDSRLIWKGTGGAYPEAPHLYKIGDHYYLMIAEGGTEYGHMVTISRSSDPYGPYESCPHNPVLSNRSLKSTIHATGHADLIQAHDGSWWAVCLGIRPASYPMRHHLGREVFLAPVTWTTDGWPIIGTNGRIDPVMGAPKLPAVLWDNKPVRDDFDGSELNLEWTFLRNPLPGSWSLQRQPGYLELRGNQTTLSDTGSPAFVGRRLCHFSCHISAAMDYEPGGDEEEAGLTVYMNERYHYDLAVTSRDGIKKIRLRRTVGSLQVEEEHACPEGPMVLKIEAQPEKFVFYYGQPGAALTEVGYGETHLLSTEVAGGFTGIFIAMYAASAYEEPAPASYDWFEYDPVG